MRFSEFLEQGLAEQDHYMVIGNPVGHSLSPLMHNIALKYLQLEAVYYAIELTLDEFPAFISHLNSSTFKGANVTIPYKVEFMPVVDELQDDAARIGALNTLYKRDGKLIGANTDAYGFMQPLTQSQDDLEGERAIVFGTGGSSRAVVYALGEMGVEEIIMVSRSQQGFDEERNLRLVSYDAWPEFADDASLLVNATPLGMHPAVDRSPIRGDQLSLLEGKICYDLIYNPLETLFLKQAGLAGCDCISGLEMFVEQGNASFQIWTGEAFPVEVIKNRLEDALGN